MKNEATARAYANIALVKYWGKRDEELILPMNGSISLTVNQFYATTHVAFDKGLPADSFTVNGAYASTGDQMRVSKFLDLVRELAKTNSRAIVHSVNRIPTAAGLASSSAGYAALATAATLALGISLPPIELSKLARRGSGSAARSIYGGFAEWLKGSQDDGSDCYAVALSPPDFWDLNMVVVLVDEGPKVVSSREGMRRSVMTSPFYSGWQATVESDLNEARSAILQRNLSKLGQIAEANAFKMHATTMGASPPFMYWQGSTLEVIRRVQTLRTEGIQAYVTIDAGPHAVVLCEKGNAARVRDAVLSVKGVKHVVVTEPGPDAGRAASL